MLRQAELAQPLDRLVTAEVDAQAEQLGVLAEVSNNREEAVAPTREEGDQVGEHLDVLRNRPQLIQQSAENVAPLATAPLP